MPQPTHATMADVFDDYRLNYHVAQMGATGINYQQYYTESETEAWMPDLNWQTCGKSLTRDDIQSIGTEQLPKSSSKKLNPSVAPPNSYNSNKTIAQQALDQMLTAKMSGYFLDTQVMDAWPTSNSLGSQLLSTGKQWLDNFNPYYEAKEAFYGVNSSGIPVSTWQRVVAGADLATWFVPMFKLDSLLAKAAIWGTEEFLGASASTSLKTLITQGTDIFTNGGFSQVRALMDFTSQPLGDFRLLANGNNLLESLDSNIYQNNTSNTSSVFGKLTNRNVVITQKGLSIVEQHLSEFNLSEIESIPNDLMVQRLKISLIQNQLLKGADAIFYTHEISETTFMNQGLNYDEAHTAALLKYQVSPFSLYHPEVISELPSYFSENWRQFWVDYPLK